MSLTLKIHMVKNDQSRAMKFAPTMSVSECLGQIKEKFNEGGEDHGLFQPGEEGKRNARWLRAEKTLQFYDLRLNDTLQYKKKHRPLRVKLVDDTIRTIIIDDSLSVAEIVEILGKKMSIKNSEEFSIKVEGNPAWLQTTQCLAEQGVGDDQMVLLQKKYFVDDANISRDDPVQLHLVYVQSRDGIISGSHPCTYDEAIQFAALQAQVQLGNHNAAIHKPGFLRSKEYMAPTFAKNKSAEKDVYIEHRKFVGTSEINAKYRYVQLCRSLKTYGITFFQTKERVKGQKKPMPKLLGITRDSVIRIDAETKEVEHEYPLTHLRRWAASPSSFTLDFGDYEEEYISVITNEGEAISQLLAGYIDILLKKRKDTGVVLDEDGNDVAQIETLGRNRGIAGTGITTSSVGGFDSSGGRESQFSPARGAIAHKGPGGPQGLQVTNVDTAQTAIANLLNEIDANPLPVPGAVSNFTPQQWKQQLQQNAKAVSAACGKLGALGAQPQQIDKTALNNVAKEVAMTVDNMITAARNATASEGEDADGEMPLMDGAKAVAEAIARVMKATKELAANPADQQARDNLRLAQELLSGAMNFLNAATAGHLADVPTTRLIAESAKAIAVATNALLGTAKDMADDIDPSKRQILLSSAQKAQNAGLRCMDISHTLAPAVLDPNCKRSIIDSCKAVQTANAQVLAAAKTLGFDEANMSGLAGAAKSVSDAIAQLMASTDLAEPRGGTDPEFSDAAKIIQSATAHLMAAQGQSNVISAQARAIAEAMPMLLAGAKRAAAQTDDEAAKQRLLAQAKAVNDAGRGFGDLANISAQHPDDASTFNKLADAARKLASLTGQLVGDAGKQAAMQELRVNAKCAAAETTALVAAARKAATSLPDDSPEAANLLAAAKAAADAIAHIMKPLTEAQKSPDNPAAQQALLEAAKKVAPVAYKLVALSKSTAPHVQNKQHKQDLTNAANLAGEAVKALAASASGATSAVGEAEFDTALESVQAMVADLESAAMFAAQGLYEAEPGAGSKEEAMELMNVSMRNLGNAAKNLAGAAKTGPDKLGPNSQDLATAVQQVVTSAKAVAGSTPNRTVQKSVLGAAKNLAGQAEAFIGGARALSAAPKDPALSQAVGVAAKAFAEALANLFQTAKGADTVGKELEEAIATLGNSAALLNETPVNLGGDFPANSEKLLASTRAISAAVAQLLNAAKSNPTAIGSAAKTLASTIPGIIDAANAAAGSAPKLVGKDIVVGTQGLVTGLTAMLQAVRAVSSRPGDKDADMGFQNAARNVSDAIRNVMKGLENSSPAQKAMVEALDTVKGALEKLQSPVLGSLPGPPLDGIKLAAKALADATTQLLNAREVPDKLAANAKKSAAALGDVVEYAKLAAAAASGQTPDGIAAHAQTVKDTCQAMANASAAVTLDAATKKQIIASAKDAALAVSALVGASRASAAAIKADAPEASKAIINAAQAIATASSNLVKIAQQAASGSPAPPGEAAKAKSEVDHAIGQLMAATANSPSNPSLDLDNLSPQSEALLAAARAIANATQQLLENGKTAVSGGATKDPAVFTNMSSAAKAVSNGTIALLNAANGLKPGQRELEEAIEAIQTASVELDGAALNAAIGLLENTAPRGKTLQRAQEELVDVAKELATSVKDLVTAAKASPDKLGPAAKATGQTTPKLASIAKQVAGLTSDNTLQQEQIGAAKNLADCLLELVLAAKSGNMADLGLHAKNASQAITAVISPIKPGVVGSKDCDDVISQLNNASSLLSKPIKPTKTYAECQGELGNVAKSLVASINQLAAAAKGKPEEVGPAAKKVGLVIPDLIELTRMAGASTTDADARQKLFDGMGTIVNATSNIINDAKLVSADRKNAQLQQQLAASFKSVTAAIGSYVATLKAAPSSEKDVDTALEDISRTMADLDTAALFAAAGQLEADTEGQTLESCQNALLLASKAIAAACTQLVSSAKGSPEQLGAASKGLAKSLKHLASLSKAAACLAGDSVSQQAMLTSARAVSIAGQQLVLSARHAQKTGDDLSQTSLGGSAQSVSDAVRDLIDFAKTASADASKGIIELDHAAADIRKLLGAFDSAAFKGNPNATAEDVIRSARAVAESTAHLVAACNHSPEEIFEAARGTHESTKSLLENSKGAAGLTDDKVIQHNVLEAAKSVANATNKLVTAAKAQRSDALNPAAQQKLSTTAGEVVEKINDIVLAASDLPGGETAKKWFEVGENLEEIAEKELMAAASIIEGATAALLEAKKRAQEQRESGLDETGINEAILDAARAIAQATSVLVSSATHCQKEIVAAGKASKSTSQYRRDPAWARGLISAAQSVAGAVQSLVGSANDATTGVGEEAVLVASARGVAAATARLVAASRAKADPMSATQQKLSNAAKSVASATSQLVEAAKAASEEKEAAEEVADFSNNSATGAIRKEIEAQAKIEKLRRELDNAHKELVVMRKKEYADPAPAPAPATHAALTTGNKNPARPVPSAPKGAKVAAGAPGTPESPLAKKIVAKKPPADGALVKKAAALKPVARPPPSDDTR